jgi:hypothetical protein
MRKRTRSLENGQLNSRKDYAPARPRPIPLFEKEGQEALLMPRGTGERAGPQPS